MVVPPSRIPLPGPPLSTPKGGVKPPCESFLKKIFGGPVFPNIDPFLDPNGFLKKFLGIFFFWNFQVYSLVFTVNYICQIIWGKSVYFRLRWVYLT